MMRLAMGMAFVLLAGILALIANGIGRAGWMLAGDSAPEPEGDGEMDLGTVSPVLSL
ncbi:MAG: hypothetical protein ACKO5K_05130 [Armatimonadota bacterium]